MSVVAQCEMQSGRGCTEKQNQICSQVQMVHTTEDILRAANLNAYKSQTDKQLVAYQPDILAVHMKQKRACYTVDG